MASPFYLSGAAGAAPAPGYNLCRTAAAAAAAPGSAALSRAAAAAAIPRGCVNILNESLVNNVTMRYHGLSLGGQGTRTVMQHLPASSIQPRMAAAAELSSAAAPTSTTGPSSDMTSDSYFEDGMEFLDDIKIDHAQLCIIETKELNKLLKNENVSKDRCTQIKQLRRTLKNRGYASTCRDKRMHEEDELRRDIDELQSDIEYYMRSIEEYDAKTKALLSVITTDNNSDLFPKDKNAAAIDANDASRIGPLPRDQWRQAPPPTTHMQRVENGFITAATTTTDQPTTTTIIKQEIVDY